MAWVVFARSITLGLLLRKFEKFRRYFKPSRIVLIVTGPRCLAFGRCYLKMINFGRNGLVFWLVLGWLLGLESVWMLHNASIFSSRVPDSQKSYKTIRDLLARPRGNIPVEPATLKGAPNVTQAVISREIRGSTNTKHFQTNKFYSRLQLFVRNVGHLSAIYCMLFDRAGR